LYGNISLKRLNIYIFDRLWIQEVTKLGGGHCVNRGHLDVWLPQIRFPLLGTVSALFFNVLGGLIIQELE
jgi:hypothetical protein